MNIKNNITFYKVVSCILFAGLVAVVSFETWSRSHHATIAVPVEGNASIKHRLSYCENTDSKDNFFLTEKTDPRYKTFIDCNFISDKENHPERISEYSGIWDTKTNIKYYLENGLEYEMGYVSILGVKDNLIFFKHCYEGCGGISMIDTKEPRSFFSGNDSIKQMYTYSVYDILGRQNIYSNSLVIVHGRVIIIDEHAIYELNPQTFGLTTLKVISNDKVFGSYSPFGNDFYAVYDKKELDSLKTFALALRCTPLSG